ncbi:hypothetical protein UQ93_24820, partial [Shigella dysenteriae]
MLLNRVDTSTAPDIE